MRQNRKAERHRDASRESVSSIIQEEQRAEIAGEPQEAMINRILDEREVMIEKADEKSSGGTKGLASKKTNGTTYKKANGLINKKTNGKIAEQQVSSAQTKTADSTVPQKSAFESLCSAVNEGQQPPDMAKEDPYYGSGRCVNGHNIPVSSFDISVYSITTPKSGCTMYDSEKYMTVYNGENWY